MKRIGTISVDCLIIGHGITGLFTASVLRSHGMSVGVVGTGSTATSLSTGCLSTCSGPKGECAEPLPVLLADRYPYSLEGDQLPDSLGEISSHLLPRLGEAGIEYGGEILGQRRFIANIGTVYASSLAPSFTLAGELDRVMEEDVALLGLLGHSDLDPDLAHAMLPDWLSPHIRPYWMQPSLLADRPFFLATEMDALSSAEEVVEELSAALADLPHDLVGLPPLFGLRNWRKMGELERMSGRQVFEIVTPLSLPGLRLQQAMEEIVHRGGTRLMRGWRASHIEMSGSEAVWASLRSRGGELRVEFSHLLLTTGDLVGGGLGYESGVRECFSTFLTSDIDDPTDLRAVSRSGLLADSEMRLTLEDGRKALNVHGAGSALSGFTYPEGVGMVGCLLTGLIASRSVRGV